MEDLLLERPKTLRSQVEESLRQAVMSGRFKPGEKLVERELCELLGVSRPSVREALRKLEAEGLIQNTPYKGLMIPTITPAEAREIYAIRGLLEGFAAAEFARKVTPAKTVALKKAVAALNAAAKRGSKESLVETKTDFYRVLLEGSENRLAEQMLMTLLFRINLLRGTTLARPDRLPKSLKEINAICERIYAGDAAGAEAEARKHIRNAEAAALEVLEAAEPPTNKTD